MPVPGPYSPEEGVVRVSSEPHLGLLAQRVAERIGQRMGETILGGRLPDFTSGIALTLEHLVNARRMLEDASSPHIDAPMRPPLTEVERAQTEEQARWFRQNVAAQGTITPVAPEPLPVDPYVEAQYEAAGGREAYAASGARLDPAAALGDYWKPDYTEWALHVYREKLRSAILTPQGLRDKQPVTLKRFRYCRRHQVEWWQEDTPPAPPVQLNHPLLGPSASDADAFLPEAWARRALVSTRDTPMFAQRVRRAQRKNKAGNSRRSFASWAASTGYHRRSLQEQARLLRHARRRPVPRRPAPAIEVPESGFAIRQMMAQLEMGTMRAAEAVPLWGVRVYESAHVSPRDVAFLYQDNRIVGTIRGISASSVILDDLVREPIPPAPPAPPAPELPMPPGLQ